MKSMESLKKEIEELLVELEGVPKEELLNLGEKIEVTQSKIKELEQLKEHY